MISQSDPPTNVHSETANRSYERISSKYDRTIAFFTGGQNLASRLAQLDELEAGDRVLYIGVGSGEDAIEAAKKGVHVTCLDLSAGMIEKARERFERAQLPGEFVCADIMQYAPEQPFDAVVANFFLNIFTRPVMEQVLTRAAGLVRSGGKLLIADFAPPRGRITQRALHQGFYRASNMIYWAKGLCPLHPIYVYSDYYPQVGLDLQTTRRFRLFLKGPWVFQTTTAIKTDRARHTSRSACCPEPKAAADAVRDGYDFAAARAAS
jgi:demethylmenaquinone methyltransferase/2-methoxy-6-polyprenyl-1,4-benzoquinol methylase